MYLKNYKVIAIAIWKYYNLRIAQNLMKVYLFSTYLIVDQK